MKGIPFGIVVEQLIQAEREIVRLTAKHPGRMVLDINSAFWPDACEWFKERTGFDAPIEIHIEDWLVIRKAP